MAHSHLPGFFRKILSRFGLKKHVDGYQTRSNEGNASNVKAPASNTVSGPVVVECTYGDGGVQGFKWYSEKLCIDEDGDVAQEFLVVTEAPGSVSVNELTQTGIKVHTNPVKLRGGAVCSPDGNVHQFVEAFGEVYWA